jgi:hypothetical protein
MSEDPRITKIRALLSKADLSFVSMPGGHPVKDRNERSVRLQDGAREIAHVLRHGLLVELVEEIREVVAEVSSSWSDLDGWELKPNGYHRGLWRIYQGEGEAWGVTVRNIVSNGYYETMVGAGFESADKAVAWVALAVSSLEGRS